MTSAMPQAGSAATEPTTTSASAPGSGPDAPPPPAAKDPVGFARVAVLGALWALALFGLAVVAGRDVLAYAGALSGDPWLERVLDTADGRSPRYWWVAAGVIAVIVGLLLVTVALRPRPRLGLRVTAATGIHILDGGLRRLAVATAEDVDGVDWASASMRRRRLRVDIRGLSADGDPELEGRVEQVLEDRFEVVQTEVRIRVRDLGRPNR